MAQSTVDTYKSATPGMYRATTAQPEEIHQANIDSQEFITSNFTTPYLPVHALHRVTPLHSHIGNMHFTGTPEVLIEKLFKERAWNEGHIKIKGPHMNLNKMLTYIT